MEGRAALLDRILLVVVVETLDTAQEVLLLASEPVASSLNQEETGRQSSVGGTPSPSLLSKTEYQTFLAIYKVRPRAPELGKVGIYIYIPGEGLQALGNNISDQKNPTLQGREREREREQGWGSSLSLLCFPPPSTSCARRSPVLTIPCALSKGE